MDGRGAIEPQFYAELLKGVGLEGEEPPHQLDVTRWDELKAKFIEVFKTKTRDEWAAIFEGTDACVSPILDFRSARTRTCRARHPRRNRRRDAGAGRTALLADSARHPRPARSGPRATRPRSGKTDLP